MQFKRANFIYFIIAFILVFAFSGIFVKAQTDTLLPDEKNLDVNNAFTVDSNNETADDEYNHESSNKDSFSPSSLSSGEENATFGGLVKKVSLIVLMLLGLLLIVKVFMGANRFGKPGSFLDELVQKVNGNFSSFSPLGGMKLKQTLILTPGQNIYLVEVDGKKLLLGGTQQGGVQFLADLNQTTEIFVNTKAQIHEHGGDLFSNSQTESPFLMSSVLNENSAHAEPAGGAAPKNTSSNQATKRRSNFVQSLNQHSNK